MLIVSLQSIMKNILLHIEQLQPQERLATGEFSVCNDLITI